jgi:hypothetical protein
MTETKTNAVSMTANEAWSLIDKLYAAAGQLSDIQEFGDYGDFANNGMNLAKAQIFEVIRKLDPRQQ